MRGNESIIDKLPFFFLYAPVFGTNEMLRFIFLRNKNEKQRGRQNAVKLNGFAAWLALTPWAVKPGAKCAVMNRPSSGQTTVTRGLGAKKPRLPRAPRERLLSAFGAVCPNWLVGKRWAGKERRVAESSSNQAAEK